MDATFTNYTKLTGTDLSKTPFAIALKQSNSPGVVLWLPQDWAKAFKKSLTAPLQDGETPSDSDAAMLTYGPWWPIHCILQLGLTNWWQLSTFWVTQTHSHTLWTADFNASFSNESSLQLRVANLAHPLPSSCTIDHAAQFTKPHFQLCGKSATSHIWTILTQLPSWHHLVQHNNTPHKEDPIILDSASPTLNLNSSGGDPASQSELEQGSYHTIFIKMPLHRGCPLPCAYYHFSQCTPF